MGHFDRFERFTPDAKMTFGPSEAGAKKVQWGSGLV
jgi:hypothetical protein